MSKEIKKVIATGAAETEDKAITWLVKHGAKVVQTELAVDLIELPEGARLERNTNNHWEWYISFYDQDGNEEDGHVSVELSADAYDTILKFHISCAECYKDTLTTCSKCGAGLCKSCNTSLNLQDSPDGKSQDNGMCWTCREKKAGTYIGEEAKTV